MGAVVLQAARATAAADHEVDPHADRRHDGDRADDQTGLLLAATARSRGLGHAVRLLTVGRLLAVRGLLAVAGLLAVRRGLRGDAALLGLLRVAVARLLRGRRLLGVAVAGLGSLRRLLTVRARLAVRSGLLGLPAVRARLVVTHSWVPPRMLYVVLTS